MPRSRPALRALLLAAALLAPAAACDVSEEEEVALGQQAASQIEAQLPLVDDPEVTGYVRELGLELARHTARPDLDWRFAIVNVGEINAFALPGGYVYVNRGLIERMTGMDQLAGVLGHEIGHVALRHSAEQLEKRNATGVGVAIVCTLTGWCADPAAQVAINVGASAYFAKHSRDDERQADSAAVETLVAAGIDPRGVPALFETLLAERRARPGLVETWFATHPLEESRIEITRAHVARFPAPALEGLRREDEGFRRMREALARIPVVPSPQRVMEP